MVARERDGELLDGRYRIEGPTAEGFAATDLTSGKRVHVAFVPREAAAGARRARELEGAHVVRVLDVGETAEGATWIAREHLSSDSVTRHLARKGPLSTRDAIEVALGVCDAVAEANGRGLFHGAIDGSNVFLAWSASGLVDVQLAGIGLCATRPRDDVRAIVKLVEMMLGGRVPADLRAVLARGTRNALDFADSLVPFATDPDFASDRIAARRLRSATSTSVFADGGYPQSAFPTPLLPVAELATAVRDVAPKRKPRRSAPTIERDMPTVVAPRPTLGFSRRRALRVLGIATAAISVALLVLIGTEGARVAHMSRAHTAAPFAVVEATPPAHAAIAPPVETPAPSAVAVPVVHTSDLPPAKPSKKTRR